MIIMMTIIQGKPPSSSFCVVFSSAATGAAVSPSLGGGCVSAAPTAPASNGLAVVSEPLLA